MSETKQFPIENILTAMHGRLLCDMGGVYEILNWLTGESLMTHQLPRASRESEGWLAEQFPDLAAVDVYAPKITDEADVVAYIASLAAEYGTHRDVAPLPPEDHTVIDPLSELRMMRPDAPIIVVNGETS